MEKPRYTFDAFISYKRGGQDEKFARWLQRKLENFKVPAQAGQVFTEAGGRPGWAGMARKLEARTGQRKFRIFRDKTDLGSHQTLNKGLTASLDECRYLLLISSPRSAESPYVNDEVRYFIQQGREECIIPVIIDGTPSPEKKGDVQCYPPALGRETLGLTLKDGTREEALLKVVARLLNRDFSSVYQRHLREQRRFMALAMGAVLCVLAMVSSVAVGAFISEKKATEQRIEAEDLIHFLTFDLRDEAFNHIPLRGQRIISERVERYYRKWNPLSTSGLYNRAEHLTNMAAQASVSGNTSKSKAFLEQSQDILEGLLKQTPDDDLLKTQYATGILNLGNVMLQEGDNERAGALIKQSIALNRQLSGNHPEGFIHKSNLADGLYSLSLLGISTGDGASPEPLTESVDILRQAVRSMPDNLELRKKLSTHLSSLCSMQADEEGENINYCQESLGIPQSLVDEDPSNHGFIQQRFESLYSAAKAYMARGEHDLGLDYIRQAHALSLKMRSLDPDNNHWLLLSGLAGFTYGWHLVFSGEQRTGRPVLEAGYAAVLLASRNDPSDYQAARVLYEVRKDLPGRLWFELRPDIQWAVEAADRLAADKSQKPETVIEAANDLYMAARQSREEGAEIYHQITLARGAARLYARYKLNAPGPDKVSFDNAGLLGFIADAHYDDANFAAARVVYLQAINELAESPDGPASEAFNRKMSEMHNRLARVYLLQGRLEEYRRHIRLAVENGAEAVSRQPGNSRAAAAYAGALAAQAENLFHEADYHQALDKGLQALGYAGSMSARSGEASLDALETRAGLYALLASIYSAIGDFQTAHTVLDEALQAGSSSEHSLQQRLQPILAAARAVIYQDADDPCNALSKARDVAQAIDVAGRLSEEQIRIFLQAQTTGIEVLAANGKAGEAEKLFERAYAELDEIGDVAEASVYERLRYVFFVISGGHAALGQGNTKLAGQRLDQAVLLAGELPLPPGSAMRLDLDARLEALRALLAQAEGRGEEAMVHYEQARQVLDGLLSLVPEHIRWRRMMAGLLHEYAELCGRVGEREYAEKLHEESLKLIQGRASDSGKSAQGYTQGHGPLPGNLIRDDQEISCLVWDGNP